VWLREQERRITGQLYNDVQAEISDDVLQEFVSPCGGSIERIGGERTGAQTANCVTTNTSTSSAVYQLPHVNNRWSKLSARLSPSQKSWRALHPLRVCHNDHSSVQDIELTWQQRTGRNRHFYLDILWAPARVSITKITIYML
jgi:hypothetical protein